MNVTEQPFVKSIRWYSTVESAENLKISVLAVMESICAVSLSLWLAWHFQSYTHIVVAIGLAPLLLLRTEESTRLGLKWFGGFLEWFDWQINQIYQVSISSSLIIGAILIIGAFFITIVLWFIAASNTWLIFTLIFLGSLGIQFIEEKYRISNKIINKYIRILIAIILVLGTAMGLIVGAAMIMTVLGGIVTASIIIIKFTATTLTFFRHPLTSLQAIPKNWYRIVLAMDMRHPPELLPGMESQRYQGIKDRFDGLCFHEYLRKTTNGDIFSKIFNGIMIPILFLPAWLYRWSLKSSALFYLPFLWIIIKTPRNIKEFKANIDEQIDFLKNSSFAIIRFRIILFLMIFTTLLPLCLRILIYYSHILPNNWHVWIDWIAPFVGTFETVQWGAWHVTNFLAQVIIIWMWFYLERLEIQRKHRKEVGIHDGKAEFVFLLMRCNQVFFAFTMICQVYIMMPYLYNLPWVQILNNFLTVPW